MPVSTSIRYTASKCLSLCRPLLAIPEIGGGPGLAGVLLLQPDMGCCVSCMDACCDCCCVCCCGRQRGRRRRRVGRGERNSLKRTALNKVSVRRLPKEEESAREALAPDKSAPEVEQLQDYDLSAPPNGHIESGATDDRHARADVGDENEPSDDEAVQVTTTVGEAFEIEIHGNSPEVTEDSQREEVEEPTAELEVIENTEAAQEPEPVPSPEPEPEPEIEDEPREDEKEKEEEEEDEEEDDDDDYDFSFTMPTMVTSAAVVEVEESSMQLKKVSEVVQIEEVEHELEAAHELDHDNSKLDLDKSTEDVSLVENAE